MSDSIICISVTPSIHLAHDSCSSITILQGSCKKYIINRSVILNFHEENLFIIEVFPMPCYSTTDTHWKLQPSHGICRLAPGFPWIPSRLRSLSKTANNLFTYAHHPRFLTIISRPLIRPTTM